MKKRIEGYVQIIDRFKGDFCHIFQSKSDPGRIYLRKSDPKETIISLHIFKNGVIGEEIKKISFGIDYHFKGEYKTLIVTASYNEVIIFSKVSLKK